MCPNALVETILAAIILNLPKAQDLIGVYLFYFFKPYPRTGDQNFNPCMCPDPELNCQLFGAQDNVQPTEPPWPGRSVFLARKI